MAGKSRAPVTDLQASGSNGGGGGGNATAAAGTTAVRDTTYTKIFVGGLAWETRRDTMRRYFEQFGEILEAVVITDKATGRSKGYGFVTFKEPEAAMRACQDPTPVIDGRRTNCNLAFLGATRHRPAPAPAALSPTLGMGRFRPATIVSSPAAYRGSSPYYQHPSLPFPYSLYGYYTGYPQESVHHQMSYYRAQQYQQHQQQQQQRQQFAPFYPSAAAGTGTFQSFYPYYTQYSQVSHGAAAAQATAAAATGFGLYPQMLHYPYPLQQYNPAGTVNVVTLPAAATTAIGGVATATAAAANGSTAQQPGAGTEPREPTDY